MTALTAVAICSVIFVLNSIRSFKRSAIENRYSIAEVTGANTASSLEFKDADAAHKLLDNLSGNSTILHAAVLDRDGHIFADYTRKGQRPYLFPKAVQTQTLAFSEEEDARFIVSYLIRKD